MSGLLTNGKLRQANLKMLFERAKQYETASFKGLYNFINFIDKLKTNSGDLSAAKVIGENDNVIRIMSIHKSKGLEFPVVFLCLTGKSFNFRDLNEPVLFHQKIGFGIKYRDIEKQIEYPTLTKEAIKLKAKQEVISEEMRVLYVALTRAKEKIIITGTAKDLAKNIKEKEEYLEINPKEKKINSSFLMKLHSYLDWLLLVYLKRKEELCNIIDFNTYSSSELLRTNLQSENKNSFIDLQKKDINKEEIEKIRKELEWKYEYEKASQIPTKTSITKLKEEAIKNNTKLIPKLITDSEKELNMKIPNFAKEEIKITGAKRGTLIHLCMQLLENDKDYTKQELETWVKTLVEKELITEKEADAIPINILINYIKSDLWKELRNAKEIHKEEPFYLHIPASKLFDDECLTEKIVAQGVIDLYYINDKDELVLVDYKTDYIENGEEQKLIDKYKEQLILYKQALEKSLNRRVDKTIIYSTWIGEIEIKK